MANRLAAATSPYLQQHRDNPVDWWEWGSDAFAEAKRRDVPVLLSVGYAACHWCHVMAHESFEDDAAAADVNAGFVAVKVDREERPDVDATYMAATQALTGHGGWPMTVFLTPDGLPFYAGTYYPDTPRGGSPSFRQVLAAITDAWTRQRPQIEDAAARIAAALAGQTAPPLDAVPAPSGEPPVPQEALEAAVTRLASEEDPHHAGFGRGMKFPQAPVLEFLLRHAARRALDAGAGSLADLPEHDSGALAAGVAGRMLRAMAHGGLYDQVAGGFARYSVDPRWAVPHFEKMLYDNAQLARVYLTWWKLTGDPMGARVAEETCDWMLAELGTPEGGLASSLDADTPVPGPDGATSGVEGLTYVWTPEQLREVLGEEDGAWAAELLQVTAAGSFEHGTSTLRLSRDPWAAPADRERWTGVRERLRAARAQRPQPGRDDKVVGAWNGLAVAALAEVGALLDRPDLVRAAEGIASLLERVHVEGGEEAAGRPGVRLRRVSRDGVAGEPGGVLEDYADVAEGLLRLFGVTGDARWPRLAGELLDAVLETFADPDGGFFDTPADGTDPALARVRRPQDPTDGPHPGGWSAAAGALVTWAALTGSGRHRDAAERALRRLAGVATSAPSAVGHLLGVAEAVLDGPREVAVVAPPVVMADGAPLRPLHRTALAGAAPGMVVAPGRPGEATVPLLDGRLLLDGDADAGYVCRAFTCRLPTADPAELALEVGALALTT